ncbi:MAG: response regulator [Anaerolineae bacterium]|nr:response regulator [Anaerolineae bacterium]
MTTQPANLPEFPSDLPRSLLIVDDDSNQLTLFTLMLRHLPYRLLTAVDGLQALDLIEQERPSIVLLDLALPGVSGLDVLRTIRADQRFSDVKVIVITASLTRLTSADVALTDDVIRKPVNRPQLEQAILAVPLAKTAPAEPVTAEVGKRRA